MIPAGRPALVPSTVDASATGSMGNFSGSDASEEVINWSSSEIYNDDTYQLAYSYLLTDSAGGVLSSETQVFIYNGNNSRTGWSLTADLPYLTNTLTFSGARIQ
jgi:hypothetical protein